MSFCQIFNPRPSHRDRQAPLEVFAHFKLIASSVPLRQSVPTTLLLRGQFVAVIKCVTVIRVGNQLSLECFVGMWGFGRLSGLRFGICRLGNDIGMLCSIMASGDIWGCQWTMIKTICDAFQNTNMQKDNKATWESRQRVEMSALRPRAPFKEFSSVSSSSSSSWSLLLQTYINILSASGRQQDIFIILVFLFRPPHPLPPLLQDVTGSHNSCHTPQSEHVTVKIFFSDEAPQGILWLSPSPWPSGRYDMDLFDIPHHCRHLFDHLVRCKAGEPVPTEELATRTSP